MKKIGRVFAAVGMTWVGLAASAAEVSRYYEYVETDGSGSSGEYVVLDYTPKCDSVIEATVSFLDVSANGAIFCARGNSTGERTFTLFNIGGSGLRWDYNRTDARYFRIDAETKCVLTAKNDGLYILDESSGLAENKIPSTPAQYVPANRMTLFGSYTAASGATPAPSANFAKLRLYSFRAYDMEGGELALKLDLRPCVDTDGRAALYDAVGEKLHYATAVGADREMTAGGSEIAYDRPNGLFVTASPGNVGDVFPAYGMTETDLVVGQSYTFTAPESCVDPDGFRCWTCRGFALYVDGAIAEKGSENVVEYVHRECRSGVRLVWLWERLAFKCFVSPTGGNVEPYDTWETAATNLNVALTVEPDEIEVGDGTYVNTDSYYMLDRAVRIYSSNGPGKTVLRAKSGGGQFEISHDGVLVSGFTIQDALGSTWTHGSCLNMSAGTVSNCLITGTLTCNYFSPCLLKGTAKIVDCDIDASKFNGWGWDNMWGALQLEENSVAERCSVHGWSSSQTMSGDLVYFPKTAVIVNSANAVLRNSLIYGNSHGGSSSSGDTLSGAGVVLLNGTVENCTVVGNASGGYGGGIYAPNGTGKIVNCIVWGNTSGLGVGNDVYAPKFASANVSYTCASDIGAEKALPAAAVGAGCTSMDPKFDASGASPYALGDLSVACIDNGFNTAASCADGAVDLAGNPRLDWKSGIVDMGCFEFVPSHEVKPLSASIDVKIPEGSGEKDVSFIATPFGDCTDGLSWCWHFGDGETDTSTLAPTHRYRPGAYTAFLSLTNALGEATNVVCDTAIAITPKVVYVAKDGSGTYPYDTWEKATNDLAVALALESPEVIVGDGWFEHTVYEHVINHSVYLHSQNGPQKTTLARRSTGTGRHFTVGNNVKTASTVISGFTLNGANGGFNTQGYFNMSGGVISNCVINGVFKSDYSTFCAISGNARAVDCEFDASAGPVWVHVDVNCYVLGISGNAVAERCVIHGYHATSGSDATGHMRSAVNVNGANAALRDSLVYDCSLNVPNPKTPLNVCGGGIRLQDGTVANCTVAGCECSGAYGGGIYAATRSGKIVNCVVWGNTSGLGVGNDIYAPLLDAQNITYTCASDIGKEDAVPSAAVGAGSISEDPLFRRPGKHNYLLRPRSPCLDAGDDSQYADLASARDLLGNPRKVNDHVDMGCYEMKHRGLLMSVR